MKQITIITGPTASGKTNYSLSYAKQFKKAIIINADASAVYDGFPVLTAQPSVEAKQNFEHLLFEIANIWDEFSVSKWLFLCESIIRDNKFDGFHKIIVGGTCMYIFLLINGLLEYPAISSEVRREAILLYQKIGHQEFLDLVLKIDETSNKDKQRLINNYCLIKETGKSFREWQNAPKRTFLKDGEFDLIKINPSREEVYNNCNLRFLKMLEMGAVEEVKTAIKTLGKDYEFKKILCADEIKHFINGEISEHEMIQKAAQKTRNLAKSQITWLRNKI